MHIVALNCRVDLFRFRLECQQIPCTKLVRLPGKYVHQQRPDFRDTWIARESTG